MHNIALSSSPVETDSSVEVDSKSVAIVNSVAGTRPPAPAPIDHSDVLDRRNDLPSISASSMEENTELETPQRPSDNNATEVASLQNDTFVSPFLSFAPFVEPPPNLHLL